MFEICTQRELRVKWYHTVNGKFAGHNLVISVGYSHLKRLYSVICHDIKLHVFQSKGFTSTSWHQQLSGQISFQMWNVLRKFEKQIKNHNTPLPSSTNPRFQNEAKCTTFLVKISKAEHLTSFWCKGPGTRKLLFLVDFLCISGKVKETW